MNRKKVSRLGVGIGILALSGGLFLANGTTAISSTKYLDKEFTVQKQVVNTFDLDAKNLKPLFLRDIYDDSIATESTEVRSKIVSAINTLFRSGEFGVGDFKPMIFLKDENTVLIAVKHSDGTVSLNEFDISKQKPVNTNKQKKEVKE